VRKDVSKVRRRIEAVGKVRVKVEELVRLGGAHRVPQGAE
jgi:hypothetical protein